MAMLSMQQAIVLADEIDGIWVNSVTITQLLFDIAYDVLSVDGDVGVHCGNKWVLVWVLVRI